MAGDREMVIVSLDNIREMLHGEYVFDGSKEQMVQKIGFDIMKSILINGYDLIVDDSLMTITDHHRIFLYDYLRSIKLTSGELSITTIQLETPVEVCIRRRMAEPRGYSPEKWREIITQINEIYKPIKNSYEMRHHRFDRVLFV